MVHVEPRTCASRSEPGSAQPRLSSVPLTQSGGAGLGCEWRGEYFS